MSSESPARVKNLPAYFVVLVGAMVGIGPFSIDTYLPSLPAMAGYFGVGIEQINFTIISYTLGYAAAQLIGGPLSDQIGRKKIGMLGLCVFIPCSLLIVFSNHIAHVQFLRCAQAFGGGFATIICMAMIRDSYEPEEAARRFPMVMMVMMIAPLVAPWVGTYLLRFGWQSNFIFLAIYALIVLVLFLRVPETAKNLTGKVSFRNIFPQYKEVLSRRIAGKLTPNRIVLASGLAGSSLLVFVTNSSFIYLLYFKINPNYFALFFGINIVIMMLLNLLTMRLLKTRKPDRIFRYGLFIQLSALSLLTMASFFMAPPLWIFIALISLTIGATGMIAPSATAMYMAYFDRLAGSAASVMSVAMFVIGVPLASLTQVFFDGSIKPIVLTMLAACILANVIALTIPRSAPKQQVPPELATPE